MNSPEADEPKAFGSSHQFDKPVGLAVHGIFGFAGIFTAIFLCHIELLRLPYFWDEAGYYIPAARDFLLLHRIIPISTLTNAHPPLLSAYLALWWKFSGYTPAVTRTAMLLVASFALLAVYRLARAVANTAVAIASLVCTATYPVWFAQSSMAHADLPAAALTLWGFVFYFESLHSPTLPSGARRRGLAIFFFSLAVLAKETAIIAPLSLAAWEALFNGQRKWKRSLQLSIPLLPLVVWFGYHGYRTGFVFGNAEYLRYNVPAIDPTRLTVALFTRLWHLFGHMNMFILSGATIAAMTCNPRTMSDGNERQRIPLSIQTAFLAILLGYWIGFSILGGALLTRYLLPAFPLVVIVGVSTLWRRVAGWQIAVAFVTGCFVVGWFVNPPYGFAPEDNLAYRDYVVLHKNAAVRIAARYSHARLLTAWPASDELTKPFLGYVNRPESVVRIEDFSGEQLAFAAQVPDEYNYALFFSTKYEPPRPVLPRLNFWRHAQQRYFDYHDDIPPQVAARMLGGQIVWEQERQGQWIALAEFPRIENATIGGHPTGAFDNVGSASHRTQ